MGSSQHYLCLYVKCVSSLAKNPTNANYLRMSIRKRVLWDTNHAFHLLGVYYVQKSALNERCRIMIFYSTSKRQKDQNVIGPG